MTREHKSLRMLSEIQELLIPAYGTRFKDLILYGSAAKGRMQSNSDIDVIILLKGPVRLWSDLKTALRALIPLALKYGHPISPKPVDIRHYATMDTPLFKRVRKEGLRLS